MNQDEHIGTRLKEWASEKNISAIAFAEQVGVQRSALSHIFSGRNKPSVDVLYKIKTTFPDIDLEWLITGNTSIKSEIKRVKENDVNSDLPKSTVTSVNNEVLDVVNQDVINISESEAKSIRDDVKLIRIIELYSDKSFKSYDP
jgi:transcriptional regulator with XRE-family HTH domain